MANIAGKITSFLGAKTSTEGTNVQVRTDAYGNVFTNENLPAGQFNAAYDGSLFVARHSPAVGGTGVALNIATTFVDTTPALILTNGEATGGKTYLPLYVRARITAAGSSSTSAEISAEVDSANRAAGTPGGTALTSTINSVNASASVPASLATIVVGALTATAAGSRRRFVGAAVAKIAASPLWLVQDVVTVTFGGVAQFQQSSQVIMSDAATPVANCHLPMPACAVPPGGSFVLNWANIANASTAPSVEFELAWIER